MCSFKQLSKIVTFTQLKPPPYKLISKTALNIQAGKKGGQAIIKKYGHIPVTEKYRQQQWNRWWQNIGQFKPLPSPDKPVCIPRKSALLAEFVGIMLGDGGISNYHISVTLHASDDAEYAEYVAGMMQKLFSVRPSVYKKKQANALTIVISRKILVKFLVSLGLPQGNKIAKGLTVPDWIQNSDNFRKACLRGLFDTDGSVYRHRYRSKDKEYSYIKIGFSSVSPTLLQQVVTLLDQEGIAVTKNHNSIAIESRLGVENFRHRIGFRNKKHLKRLCR